MKERGISMRKALARLLSIAVLVSVLASSVNACTSFIIKTKDGSPVYGRTLEWGAFDTKSDLVTDSAGNSIVIEYVDSKLNIYDNKIGVMTNSPTYDWHLLNLRNYTQLTSLAPGRGDRGIDGVNFTPFGGGAGMTGLPGDYSSPSRFIRAFFYTQTSLPLEDVDEAVNQASRILDNFDYPKGFERTGTPDKYSLGYTQWSIIGDIKNKQYYWWTQWNRQMQMVDLSKLNFDGSKVIAIPLDRVRAENIDDRTKDFSP